MKKPLLRKVSASPGAFTPGIGISKWRDGKRVSQESSVRLQRMKGVFGKNELSRRRKIQVMERMILTAMSSRELANNDGKTSRQTLQGKLGSGPAREMYTLAVENLIAKRKIMPLGTNQLIKVAQQSTRRIVRS